jgi:hypothetical protein
MYRCPDFSKVILRPGVRTMRTKSATLNIDRLDRTTPAGLKIAAAIQFPSTARLPVPIKPERRAHLGQINPGRRSHGTPMH